MGDSQGHFGAFLSSVSFVMTQPCWNSHVNHSVQYLIWGSKIDHTLLLCLIQICLSLKNLILTDNITVSSELLNLTQNIYSWCSSKSWCYVCMKRHYRAPDVALTWLPYVHCGWAELWCSRWTPRIHPAHSSTPPPTSAAEHLWMTCFSSRRGSSRLTRQKPEMKSCPWRSQPISYLFTHIETTI